MRAARPGAHGHRRAHPLLRAANLVLLLLYPLAWSAPLLRAGVLPFFGGTEVSILSGLRALWPEEPLLFALVALFGMVAPCAKTLGLALMQWGIRPRGLAGLVHLLGRLAMADIFLVALYVIVVKGTGLGYVDTAWGLPLFTGLVIGALAITWLSEKDMRGWT